jgi:hypothetical protein
MIQNVLRHMGGIENYGLISLFLFFGCFLGMLVWALLLKKPFLKEMSRLPLDTDPEQSTPGVQSHE